MKKNSLDNLLDKLNESDIPTPDSTIKTQTISQATDIFRQGFDESARHTDETTTTIVEKPTSLWSKIMSFLLKPNKNPIGYKAISTGAIALAVLSVVMLSPALFSPTKTSITIDNFDEEIPQETIQKPETAALKETVALKNAALTNNKQAASKLENTPKPAVSITEKKINEEKTNKKQLGHKQNSQSQNTAFKDTDKASNTQLQPSNASQTLAKTSKEANATNTAITADSSDAFMAGTPEPIITSQAIVSETAASNVVKPEIIVSASPVTQSTQSMTFTTTQPKTATGSSSTYLAKSKREIQAKTSKPYPEIAEDSIQLQSLQSLNRQVQKHPQLQPQNNQEEFTEYLPNSIQFTTESPISTFSIDVDTASYTLVRNQLNQGRLPNPQSIRVEEFINYFDYNYPLPENNVQPFTSNLTVINSPWNNDKKLIHIGIQGYDLDPTEQPDSNIVFLLDVSGSMNQSNKLPLVKQSINLLLDTLKPTDTVSIVVYAGAAGAVLEPTKVSEKNKIIAAIQNLSAGGSTAGSAGIELAYQLAEQNFDNDAVNRIILATDGDFNVGRQSHEELKALVERKRNKGIFLSVLGFGRGNYKDAMMQTLAQNGNGVAAYIDSLSEAKKVLIDEATSTLFNIAKDVKLQVEFNPHTVSDYRLIGYETRALKKEDFNNDKVDAGDIGAGHNVTAIYEITPANAKQQTVDPSRYNKTKETNIKNNNEYGFLKIRYKLPTQNKSKLIETAIPNNVTNANKDILFSIAVAGFGQLLSQSKYTGDLNYDDVLQQAINNKGKDDFGYRAELINLVRMAKIAQ